MGEDVDRCVKGSFLGPGDLSLVEHAVAHDVGADALGGAAQEVVDRAGLSPRSELEEVLGLNLLKRHGIRVLRCRGGRLAHMRGVSYLS